MSTKVPVKWNVAKAQTPDNLSQETESIPDVEEFWFAP
jgi:hypothetical protein